MTDPIPLKDRGNSADEPADTPAESPVAPPPANADGAPDASADPLPPAASAVPAGERVAVPGSRAGSSPSRSFFPASGIKWLLAYALAITVLGIAPMPHLVYFWLAILILLAGGAALFHVVYYRSPKGNRRLYAIALVEREIPGFSETLVDGDLVETLTVKEVRDRYPMAVDALREAGLPFADDAEPTE